MPCLALTLLGLSSARSDAATQVIALKGDAAPGLVGTYSSFSDPVLNGTGVVAFVGTTSITSGAVYKTSSGGLVTIAKSGDSAPLIGGTFNGFSGQVINESGTVAFFGTNGVFVNQLPKTGLYTGNGSGLTNIAAYGQAALTLTGNITVFGTHAGLSDAGSVIFKGVVSDGVSDTTLPMGIYAGSGGGTATTMNATTIASTSQTAPTIGGIFYSLDSAVYNNLGITAFTGFTTIGSAPSAIYSSFGGTLNTIAATTQTVPVLGGTFSSVVNPAINDQGTVAFTGQSTAGGSGVFTGTGGSLTTIVTTAQASPSPLVGNFTAFFGAVLSNSGVVAFRGHTPTAQGIFTGSGGALQTIANTTQPAPAIGGTFTGFSRFTINDLGVVAFVGANAADPSNSPLGLYLSDGQEIITAAYSGGSIEGLAGRTIANNGIFLTVGPDRGGNSQLNNNGQIAYRVTLNGAAASNTAVLLFTPTLRFRNAAGGSWSTRNNWTVGILPASVHDVVIDPAAALAVNGPLLPTTVNSLAIGTGAGLADLALQSSGTITAPGGVSTGSTGKIRGNGKLVANLTNAGTIAPGLPSSAGSLTVTGNVTLQATSRLALDLGGLVQKTSYDFLSVSGAFTLGGNLDLSLLGAFTPLLGHTFDLFNAASTTGSFAALNLPTLTTGLGWNTSLLATTGVISVVSTGPINATWNLPGSGSWSAALASNWNPAVPNGTGTVANFGTAITGNSTVSVDTAKTVGKITFNNANSYTITGTATDTITLADSAATPQISVTLGSHTISAPLILAQNTSVSTAPGTTLTISGGITGGAQSLTKTGTGTLNLDGPQSYAALNATAGATTVDGAVGSGAAVVSVTGTGTTLKFGTVSQTLASLTIGAGAKVTFTSGAASFGGDAGKASGHTGSAVVPEPGALGLLLTGLLGFLARRPRAAR